jgi:hypothetical protein
MELFYFNTATTIRFEAPKREEEWRGGEENKV